MCVCVCVCMNVVTMCVCVCGPCVGGGAMVAGVPVYAWCLPAHGAEGMEVLVCVCPRAMEHLPRAPRGRGPERRGRGGLGAGASTLDTGDNQRHHSPQWYPGPYSRKPSDTPAPGSQPVLWGRLLLPQFPTGLWSLLFGALPSSPIPILSPTTQSRHHNISAFPLEKSREVCLGLQQSSPHLCAVQLGQLETQALESAGARSTTVLPCLCLKHTAK